MSRLSQVIWPNKHNGYSLCSCITCNNWCVAHLLIVLLLPNNKLKLLFDNFFEISSQRETDRHHK